ncbi:MAG: DNA repair and recombination protein RadB, partial [Candidatus Nanoarchaeia archaeon]|nr:DNA repair and recombination protein RadB [Candidatus Nanoarchaeia archaeon]
SGTGKTNFCLLAAVSQAKKGNKVIYIDTEGGFSTERVKQMAGEEYKKVLENILLLKPMDFPEQKKVFDKLHSYLKDEVSLLVVDGLTILYRLDSALARSRDERGDKNNETRDVNSELVRQIRILAEIARKHCVPVLVTSQVYNWEDEQRIVGGDILKYWAKCWIELRNKDGTRTAFLRKHRSLPEKEINFKIINDGIKKAGWI